MKRTILLLGFAVTGCGADPSGTAFSVGEEINAYVNVDETWEASNFLPDDSFVYLYKGPTGEILIGQIVDEFYTLEKATDDSKDLYYAESESSEGLFDAKASISSNIRTYYVDLQPINERRQLLTSCSAQTGVENKCTSIVSSITIAD